MNEELVSTKTAAQQNGKPNKQPNKQAEAADQVKVNSELVARRLPILGLNTDLLKPATLVVRTREVALHG